MPLNNKQTNTRRQTIQHIHFVNNEQKEKHLQQKNSFFSRVSSEDDHRKTNYSEYTLCQE